MHAGRILLLVTGVTLDRVQTVSIRAAPDLHGVRMAIVSLTRIVTGRMAVHAARMAQYGNNGFESSRGIAGAVTFARARRLLNCRADCQAD
jgi:hypothetical protein